MMEEEAHGLAFIGVRQPFVCVLGSAIVLILRAHLCIHTDITRGALALFFTLTVVQVHTLSVTSPPMETDRKHISYQRYGVTTRSHAESDLASIARCNLEKT